MRSGDGWPLRVLVNGITGRSFSVSVPYAIDTLVELCEFISTVVPFPSNEPEIPSFVEEPRYRFLYSTAGAPLWRVTECRELGTIVVSQKAGYIPDADSLSRASKSPSSTPPLYTTLSETVRSSSSPAPSRPVVPLAPSHHRTDTTEARRDVKPGVHRDSSSAAGPSPILLSSQEEKLHRPSSTAFYTNEMSSSPVSPALDEWRRENCELLLIRKWRAFQQMRHHKEDLLGHRVMRRRVEGMMQERRFLPHSSTPLRVVVTGPPGSGVSTTAAMLVSELLHSYTSSVFSGLLVVPMDLPLLLFEQEEYDRVSSLYLWCELVLHAVIDAAWAVRRSFHVLSAADVTEFWTTLICPVGNGTSDPQHQSIRIAIAEVIGEAIVLEWESCAEGVEVVLRSVAAAPNDMKVRDEGLYEIFRVIPFVLARTLGFSGLFFIIDNVEVIACGMAPSSTRPLGDLSAVLEALCDTDRSANLHVLVASSSASQPLVLSYVPGVTAWIKTVGWLEKEDPALQDLPLHIHTFTDTFDLGIFLWAPGYVATLLRLGLGEKARESGKDHGKKYCVRLDYKEVQLALKGLRHVVTRGGVDKAEPSL